MLNVALPKGRLGEKVYGLFARAGFECPAVLENTRKLIFENPDRDVRYFWVKPSDVAIYVARGAADVGVVDVGRVQQQQPGPEGFQDRKEQTLRVATKFSRIARDYYAAQGRDIDIIHLNGSIEIAPILGLSDVIVDIVETGTTLKENHLAVLETIVPVSARLIANKSGFKFKTEAIERLMNELRREVAEA